ncbi:hypothetical protein [Gordonia pseudamarae]|jgi:hypothetical protein|uniref:hypothetical protein n=1 Tax=Gordonia pseudamarae TaxID=2831662 RepID=UPI001AFBB432|nr:hypothetical protein [Gordonia pseudamarae]QHN28962.1 hypothetical protein GII33_23040 [Gordonia pseudamarae]
MKLKFLSKVVPPVAMPFLVLPVVVTSIGAPPWWLAFAGAALIAQQTADLVKSPESGT